MLLGWINGILVSVLVDIGTLSESELSCGLHFIFNKMCDCAIEKRVKKAIEDVESEHDGEIALQNWSVKRPLWVPLS